MAEEEEVSCERLGPLGLITLNRPKALNALTLGMVRSITQALLAWRDDGAVAAVVIEGAGDKAFCAGGDVRALADLGPSPEIGAAESSMHFQFFHEEYRLNRLIHFYPKPYIALVDGVCMGGGLGLSLHGRNVVVTERTLMAMPETGLGLFPDIGGSWFLNRCPGAVGMFLGLTGARLRGQDCLDAGLAQNVLPSAAVPVLREELRGTDWGKGPASAILEDLIRPLATAVEAEPRVLPDSVARRATIDELFAADTLPSLVAAVEAEADSNPWLAKQAERMRACSPLSLHVTHRQLREARTKRLDDMLVTEFRLSQRCMAGSDFFEGVRALLVDRDNAPRWKHERVEDVDDAAVDAYFAPLAGRELVFHEL